MRKSWLSLIGLALLTALVGGCAAGAAPRATAPPSQLPLDEVRALSIELEQQERSLAALEAGQKPDCARARELVQNICLLAKRICQIAERNSGQPDLDARCLDARLRCERAGQLLTGKCSAAS